MLEVSRFTVSPAFLGSGEGVSVGLLGGIEPWSGTGVDPRTPSERGRTKGVFAWALALRE